MTARSARGRWSLTHLAVGEHYSRSLEILRPPVARVGGPDQLGDGLLQQERRTAGYGKIKIKIKPAQRISMLLHHNRHCRYP